MVRFFFSLFFMTTLSYLVAQSSSQNDATMFSLDKAFNFFDADGNPSNSEALMKKAMEADIIFFGELHNNPVAHWLQLEMTEALFTIKDGKITLGAEMFESDNQILMDEYFQGIIAQKNFEEEARLWNNYETDYKPILEFAKAHQLNFIATNIPRRYANLVFRAGFEGLDKLSEEGKSYIAPLPIPYDPELPGYKKMIEMMGGHGGPTADNLPKAQAIKDATMGYFISQNLQDGHTFIHLNGSYHSDNKEGIIWYVNQYKPDLKIITITTIESSNVNTLPESAKGKADFTVVINQKMTKTY